MPFFPDTDSEAETPADAPADPKFSLEERREEREMRIAGLLARHAEEAGLVRRSDDFSWEWHQQFDDDLEAAQAAAPTAASSEGGEAQAPAAKITGTAPITAGELNGDLGTGGRSGGDFGGGEIGGNF